MADQPEDRAQKSRSHIAAAIGVAKARAGAGAGRSADAKQAAGEGLTTQGKFGCKQGDEAEHGHTAI